MIRVDGDRQQLCLISRPREQRKAAITVIGQEKAGAGEIRNLIPAPPSCGWRKGCLVGFSQPVQSGGVGGGQPLDHETDAR